MSYLIQQILLCLLLAFILGAIIGWLIKRFYSNKEIIKLESDLDRANNETKEANNSRETLNSEFASFRTNSEMVLGDIETKNSSLSEKLGLAQQDVTQLAPYKVEAEEGRLKLDSLSKNITVLQNEVTELKPYKVEAEDGRKKLGSLENNVNLLKQKVTELAPFKGEAEDSRKKMQSLQAEYKMASAEFQSKKTNMSQKLSKLSALPGELQNRDSQIESLKSSENEYKRKLQQLSSLEGKLQKAEQQLTAKEKRVAEEKQNLERVQKQLQETNQLVETRDKTLSDTKSQLEKNSQDKSALQQKLSDMEQNLKTIESDRSKVAKELEAQVADSAEKAKTSENDARKYQSQVREVNEHATKMERLEAQLRGQSTLDKEMHDLRASLAGLKSSSTQKNRDLEQSEKQIASLQGEVKNLKDANAKADSNAKQEIATKEALASKESQLREAQTALENCRKSGQSQQQTIAQLERNVAELKQAQVSNRQAASSPVSAPQQSVRPATQASSSARTPLFVAPAEKDDLKKIYGIGPVMEGILNELGITSFKQISEFSKPEIEKVAKPIVTFPDRIERNDWVGGAREQYRKKYL